MISPAALAGGCLAATQLAAECSLPTLVALDPGVAGGDGVERLLLGAHDRLQRRVARLVDGVADRDDGGQVHLDGVVAVLGLALAGETVGGRVHLDHLRQRRHAEVLGHDGADRVALAVVGLLAEQDQVGALALEHLRERVARRGDVGARERRVGEVHGAIRAQGHGLVERAHGGLGAHRHGDDLLDRDGATLLDLHRRLDGVRVVRVEVLLPAAIHQPRVGVEPLLHRGIWHLFDEDTDLHLASCGRRTSRSVPSMLTDESVGRGPTVPGALGNGFSRACVSPRARS